MAWKLNKSILGKDFGIDIDTSLPFHEIYRLVLSGKWGKRDERKTCVGIYTSRLVDNAQGVRHEQSYRPVRRPNSNGSRISPLSENLQSESLQHGKSEGNTVYQAEEKREDQNVGPDEVAGTSG